MWFFLQKPLDKCESWCYNIKSCPKGNDSAKKHKKISKKVKKLSKKVLTSGFWCGIISKSLRELRHRSLKIEQQERSTKLKNSMCIGSRTIQKRILLKQKVKLLRAKARCNRLNQLRLFWYNDIESLILAQDERWRRA